MTTALPTAIRAQVSTSILDKVSRIFNGSLGDIFVELLQNARRAGATAIDITAATSGTGGLHITVKDNGTGIEDPSILLHLGDSDWEERLIRHEDAAGMGFFALSAYGARVRSRAFTIDITPAVFHGREAAAVIESDHIAGTEISFVFPETKVAGAENALRDRVRYFPLPVTFNGAPVERQSFLDGAISESVWNGLRFGLFIDRSTYSSRREHNLNFHGVVVPGSWPAVSEIAGPHYSVRVDIIDCPHLKLVLPARKEVVENAFLAEARIVAERLIYTHVAKQRSHSLPFKHWQRARELGIDLIEAERKLRPWTADVSHNDGHIQERQEVPADAIIVPTNHEDVHLQQSLKRALTLDVSKLQLLDPDSELQGYSWYNALPRLEDFAIRARFGRRTITISGEVYPSEKISKALDRKTLPQSADVTFTIRHKDKAKKVALPIDVVLGPIQWNGGADEEAWTVTADKRISVGDLTDILYDTYFSPHDDSDFEPQRDSFNEIALTVARKLLMSKRDAQGADIYDKIHEHVRWQLLNSDVTQIVITPVRKRKDHVPDLKVEVRFAGGKTVTYPRKRSK